MDILEWEQAGISLDQDFSTSALLTIQTREIFVLLYYSAF